MRTAHSTSYEEHTVRKSLINWCWMHTAIWTSHCCMRCKVQTSWCGFSAAVQSDTDSKNELQTIVWAERAESRNVGIWAAQSDSNYELQRVHTIVAQCIVYYCKTQSMSCREWQGKYMSCTRPFRRGRLQLTRCCCLRHHLHCKCFLLVTTVNIVSIVHLSLIGFDPRPSWNLDETCSGLLGIARWRPSRPGRTF